MSPSPISPDIIGGNEKFLLYGDPGVGKTHCALTAPPPIYFVSVSGPDEVQTYYSKYFQEKYGERLPEKDLLVDYTKTSFSWGLGEGTQFDQVKQMIETTMEMEEKGEIPVSSTIVIDNMTTLTEQQVSKAIVLSDQVSQSEKASTREKYEATGVLQVADFEWKDVMNMMAKFLSELFTLDKNIVIVAHEWEQTVTNRKTKQSDVIAIKPLFIGKQRDLIANLFSNVWRIYPVGAVSSAARTVSQEQNPNIIAKTRVGGVVSRDYMDPDLSSAIGKFKKHAEEMSKKSKK